LPKQSQQEKQEKKLQATVEGRIKKQQYGLQSTQSLQRKFPVSPLSFAGNPETPGVHPSGMDFTVTVSTFYMTGMDELKSGLPWTEYPKPAGKKNPLYTGP
jgi:type IV pilus assembly protein PilO